MEQFSQLLVSGIANGCIYAIVAIGFSIIYAGTQVINFAQGEFVMVGAMVAAVLLAKVSLLIAFPVAILAGCLVGAVVGLCVLIPLKRASVVSLVILTVGASLLIRGLAQLFWGEEGRMVPYFTGVTANEDNIFHFAGAVIGVQQIWVVAITIALVIATHCFFKYTLTGRAMRACALNPTGARLVGINVHRMIILSFIMAAGLGAVAGVTVSAGLYARCTMGAALGLKGFCAAVLGGLGNYSGGIAAGVLLGVVESLIVLIIPSMSDYSDAAAFVILLVVLLLKPDGILARKKAVA
ncbi:MAG: branched-chain amino acid ABC transporter permease [Armatimonadetes bacterium]|jgi:branched-chain amino acid transport system permease protein|nr:branched-chain amino acid ABC transporter permease [Armatimonadota bacterium]